MPLNVAQLMAPYSSGQALTGLVTGVIEGTGIDISVSGVISLSPTEAASLGFIVSGAGAAPILNWPATDGPANATLRTDGAGNLSWSTDYVQTTGSTGAAALPVGATGQRPTAAPGYLRYNSDIAALEWSNASSWDIFGTVTSVTATAPIVSSGGVDPVISLADTAVTPGSYTYSSFTVDQKGRLIAASSGVDPNTTVVGPITNTGTTVEPIIGILPASTSQAGAVQLNNTLNTPAIDQALTAAQGQILSQQITSLILAGGLTNAGTFDATTGLMTNVSVAGANAGFVVGQNIPSPSTTILDHFVQVTVAGTYSPPGGGGPFNLVPGDWLFCNGTDWIQVNIGARLSVATTTSQGVIRLGTQSEVDVGTDSTLAVTPATLQGKMSDSIALNDSRTIASSAAVRSAANTAGSAIPCSVLVARGDIIVANAAATPSALGVGPDGYVLTANSACVSGVEWQADEGGSVTSITAGTGLSGGTITTSGTIAIANTGVTAGNYTYSSLTVNAQGQITAASSGTPAVTSVTGTAPIQVTAGLTPVVSVDASSTTAAGVVQLNNTLNTPATDLALTAAQGQILSQMITGLVLAGGLTNAGTFDAATGLMTNVSVAGTNSGFVIGQNIPSPSTTILDHFVQITVAGTYSPPGGGGPFNLIPGDWLFCNGTKWIQINIGARLSYATTTSQGVVRLGTQSEVNAGTDATLAVTPATLQGKMSDLITLPDSKRIASSAAVNTVANIANAAIPCSVITAKGALITGTAAATPTALPVGVNGQVLRANSLCAGGLEWYTVPAAATYAIQNIDDISSQFNDIQTTFNLTIASVAYSPVPSTNISVYLGAVPQIPGPANAYTISGSTITFSDPPPSGASFYAFTVA